MNKNFAQIATAFSLTILGLGGGCTNNFLRSVAPSSSSNTVSASNPGSFNNTSGGLLTVVRAQKDNFDPSGTIALIGDGSNAMGQFCTAKDAATGNSGASTCTCAFSFVSGGNSQSFEVDTTYHESNLLRCPSTNIPSDATTVTISVHLTNVDTFSNTVKFASNAGSTFNPLSAESFAAIQRIQCRDIVTINYLFDTAVYDPILSEDPRYSYPLNFYTTNIGRTMAYYAGALGGPGINSPTGWNCPVQQTDQPIQLNPYTPGTTVSTGLNFKVFSTDANSAGSKLIYPPGAGWNRHDFVVAREKSGVFSVPVNAYVYPGQFTQTQGSGAANGIPPLGFAASPVISASGESCPDTSVSIPSGYHWAKLWLFRAQLAQRTFPTSGRFGQLGEVACNPGKWDRNAATAAADAADSAVYTFPDCAGSTRRIFGPGATTPYARFSLSTGMCWEIQPGLGALAGLGAGTDRWFNGGKDQAFSCASASANDVVNSCGPNPPAAGNSPRDTTVPTTTGTIDQLANGAIRYDYLFTVTPPSVTRADMDESASTTLHNIYTPLRFQLLDDCQSNDPSFPLFAGDCDPAKMIKYKLKKHEVGAGGNDQDGTPGDFPVCVLQKD